MAVLGHSKVVCVGYEISRDLVGVHRCARDERTPPCSCLLNPIPVLCATRQP